jgi:hypothetical protein
MAEEADEESPAAAVANTTAKIIAWSIVWIFQSALSFHQLYKTL